MLSGKKICFFCASSDEINVKYIDSSKELARILAEEKTELIFGGGTRSIMGAVAGIYKEHKLKVTSVIPEKLNQKGILFEASDELIVTKTMSERKKIMADISDAFIALPGGFGTLEEILEIITLKQLGFIDKPIVIFNPFGFYDHLIKQIEFFEKEKFISASHRELYFVSSSPEEILNYLKTEF
jgi:cytokinin riboside 5'-monophosphate phosphoribohydrolase